MCTIYGTVFFCNRLTLLYTKKDNYLKEKVIFTEGYDIFEADALKKLLLKQADHHRREVGDFPALNKAPRSCCFITARVG